MSWLFNRPRGYDSGGAVTPDNGPIGTIRGTAEGYPSQFSEGANPIGWLDKSITGQNPTQQLGPIIQQGGEWLGKGMGMSQFNTDPTQYQMPGFGGYQAATQNGMLNQAGTIGGQRQLQGQLSAEANGQGYNAATQQLQNATDAGNRNAMSLAQSTNGGAGGNMAAQRNILENQAINNQQAAGQSADVRGQQQLAAQGQLQGLLGQQQQGQLGYMNAGQTSANDQLQANIAQQQLQQQSYQNSAQLSSKAGGGLLQGAGSLLAMLAHGGEVPGYAEGGKVGLGFFGLDTPTSSDSSKDSSSSGSSGLLSGLGGMLGGSGGGMAQGGSVPGYSFGGWLHGRHHHSDDADSGAYGAGGDYDYSGPSTYYNGLAQGPDYRQNSFMDSPGLADGGYAMGLQHGHALAMLMGGHVPGKARVDGDSSKNDTVDAKLSPGEIVLPRSVTQDEDAAEKAKLFVEAIKKKKG